MLPGTSVYVLQLHCCAGFYDSVDVDNHAQVLSSVVLCDSTGDQSSVPVAMV